MQNRGQVLVGSSLILFGGGLLLASVLRINFWAICFPMTLIVVGVFFLIARPPMWEPTTAEQFPVRRRHRPLRRVVGHQRRVPPVRGRCAVGHDARAVPARRDGHSPQRLCLRRRSHRAR